MAIRVVFNADDFGYSSLFNRAVLKAHREGVLTSASLMVTGEKFEEAVSIARECPRLSVGIHLVLCGGRSVLPPSDIPALVDSRGNFSSNPVWCGLKYYFMDRARGQISKELSAQVERFFSAGLRPAHLNSHLNVHANPVVFPIMADLARRYKIPGIRIARDCLRETLSLSRRRLFFKCLYSVIFDSLYRWNRSRCYGLGSPAMSYGLLESGHMTEAFVLGILERLKPGDWEIYFHPTDGPHPVPGYEGEAELRALLSQRVKALLSRRGIERIDYQDLP